MKPTHDAIAVESTLVGEEIELTMSARAEDQSHLASMAIDMYEDPIMAVAREYYTNALDAHIEDNVDRPVEISLPTALMPSFRVRDFGEGLDLDDMRTIYSQYGRSTKRESNDVNGVLGIGCKSALSYAQSFAVTSTKDGRAITVNVARNEDGGATMMVLEDKPSADESGTEVIVPVQKGDYHNFEEAAEHLYRFAPPGKVTVNGEEPEHVSILAFTLVEDKLYVLPDGEENDYIVMGNVPYPCDLGKYTRHSNYSGGWTGRAIVAFVDNGDVHFTPSREGLRDSERTKARIEGLKVEFENGTQGAIEREVAAATSKPEAFRAYWDGCQALELGGNQPEVRYQGEVVPTCIKYDSTPDDAPDSTSTYRYRANYRRNSDDTQPYELRVLPKSTGYGRGNENTVKSRLYADDLEDDILWVTDFAPTTFSKTQRTRIEDWQSYKGWTLKRPVLVKQSGPPMPEWMDQASTVSWSDLRKWKDPNAPLVKVKGGSRKVAGTYYTLGPDEGRFVNETKATDLPKSGLFYMVGSKHSGGNRFRELDRHIDGKVVLVVLPENRLKKFLRDFPHAAPSESALVAVAWLAWDTLTDSEKLLHHWSGTTYEEYVNALTGTIDDPEVRELKRLIGEKDRLTLDLPNIGDTYGLYEEPKAKLDVIDDVALGKRYPLLDALPMYRRQLDKTPSQHLTIYMNAAYAAERK